MLEMYFFYVYWLFGSFLGLEFGWSLDDFADVERFLVEIITFLVVYGFSFVLDWFRLDFD
jgi:hypothetical protein